MENVSQIKVITTLLVLMVVLPAVIFVGNYNPDDIFEVKVYETGDGFGYDITTDDMIIIKQENIPAIPQHKNFTSYEHAELVATVVVEKLNKGLNPGISIEELKRLGILSVLGY